MVNGARIGVNNTLNTTVLAKVLCDMNASLPKPTKVNKRKIFGFDWVASMPTSYGGSAAASVAQEQLAFRNQHPIQHSAMFS